MTIPTFLIEDSPTIRESLIPALEALASSDVLGFAETQDDAVQWLVSNPEKWDLAVVDIFLREGSGLGVLSACRSRRPNQRMVVLSNYATAEMRSQCIKLGADEVFDKSNELDAFFDFIQSGASEQMQA